MKNTFILFSCIILLFSSFRAAAHHKPYKTGIGGEFGIPTGTLGNVANNVLGLSLHFETELGPGFITATSGFISFGIKNGDGGSQLPLKFGYKYPLTKHVFAMGELGYSHLSDIHLNESHGDAGGFTYAPAIGTEMGILQLSVRYETIIYKTTNLSYVAASIGIYF